MGLKKILVPTGLVFGGLLMFGAKKYQNAKDVISNLELSIKSLSKVQPSLTKTTFNAILSLTNTTNIDFGATLSSKIVVKNILVYTVEGIYLGKANTHFYEIDLPAGATVDLPEAMFELDSKAALTEFLSNLDKYLTNNLENLTFKIEVQAFGNTITINA